MAQGKLKTKTKLPSSVKKNKPKGNAATKRLNAPNKPKKVQNLKQMVMKTVNKSVENEMRHRASNKKKLSRVQETVAKINKSEKASTSSS